MSSFNDASIVQIPSGYKASTLYSIKPSSGAGDFSVVRNTTATRVNQNGLIESVAANVPRIDYLNGGCGELLVEEQRTNLLERSEEFDNVDWTKTNATISADATTAPGGNATADKLVENSATAGHSAGQSLSALGANTTYTASVFAKASERNFILLNIANAGNYAAYFNLSNGTVGTVQSNITSATIKDYGNGWYRCVVTATVSSGLTPLNRIFLADADNNANYLGDGSSGVFIWGAQLEEGSYASSYIPTTTTAVTRNQDVISLTGASDLLGDSAGGMFLEASVFDTSISNNNRVGISDGTSNNRVLFLFDTQAEFFLESGTIQAFISGGSITANAFFKVAVKYGVNDISFYKDGANIGVDTSANTFADGTLDRFEFRDATGNPFYGRIRQLVIFDQGLLDDEIESVSAYPSFAVMASSKLYTIL